MRRVFVGGLSCLLLAGPGLSPSLSLMMGGGRSAWGEEAAARPTTTVVRPGEDCQGVVRRVYGTGGNLPSAMARFHAANPHLGGLPHQIHPGDVVNTPPLARVAAASPSGAPQRSRREPRTPDAQRGAAAKIAEVPRLSYVGPAVRTQTQREGWTEALPEQPVSKRMRIQTSAVGGAEIQLKAGTRLQLDPNATLVIDAMPRKQAAGEVALIDGTVHAGGEQERAGQVTVHTQSADVRLRGGARIDAQGKDRAAVAVYEGAAAVRAHGREVNLRAGQGTLVRAGARPQQPRSLPGAPQWRAQASGMQAPASPGDVFLALSGLREPPATAPIRLDFAGVPTAEQYLIEIARDERFNERRAGGEIVTPPFQIELPTGVYYVRVSAIDADRLVGPPSAVRRVRVVSLRTDAARRPARPGAAGPPVWSRPLRAQVLAAGDGAPLSLQLDDGPQLDCSAEGRLDVPPGDHLVTVRAEEGRASLRVVVAGPPLAPPPPPPVVAAPPVEPLDLPVPLTSPGFPVRAIQPRTRAYALFGIGAAVAGHQLDVYRLDLGGELALFSRRFSMDVNLPLLYQSLGALGQGGAALGDLSFGLRALTLSAAEGRVALGPLLRVQVPTGTFNRVQGTEPGHPVVIDPAAGLGLRLGPLGLLTTQGFTAVVNVATAQASWSMSYVAQVALWRLSLVAELDGALGIVGQAPSGASLGGGARVSIGHGVRLVAGARGGLGSGGQAVFGQYQASTGVEWVR